MKRVIILYMHTKTINLLALAFLALLLSACNTQNAEQANQQPLSKIAVIGDSIGNGYNLATPWPTLVKEKLKVSMFNTSISGKQTGWGLEIIDDILDTHRPSHLLISLGTNDATRGPCDGAAIANLQAMVDIANAKGVTVIVGTVIPNHQSKEADQHAQQINIGILQLSNASIVDVRAKMGDAKSLLADGVHPNQQGQQVIANAFLEQLMSLAKFEEG
ncbi:MAG: acyl-CoA thioesterase-1 [Arenicella sp.]|jgi:acyl-CoA thioesterase-1